MPARERMPDEFARTREYALTANERGAAGEAIVAAAARRIDAPNPIREFARADLDLDDDVEVRVQPRSDTHLQRLPGPDGPLEWRPDLAVAVQVRGRSGWRTATTYLVEVKTGAYADFEREQRETMRRLAGQGFDVLAVNVILEEMPDEFGVRVRRIEEE